MRSRFLTVIVAITLLSTPCYAETCHDLAMSYIIHDQDPPTEPGDYLYHEDGTKHKLTETTGYCMGTHGSHGDKMKVGYVAYTPETYGYCMEIYQAIETDEGYKLGPYLGLYEIRDCGYGRRIKESDQAEQIQSRVTSKSVQGTIEAGLSVDRYAPTYAECKEWMQETNGMIFIRIIPGKG